MDCCTYLARLTTLVCPTSLCRLEPFTTEKVYIHVYVRYEYRQPVPISSFPFPTYYPDTGTGSCYPNRTCVGPLTQPLLKHISQRLTPLHTLSPLILPYVPPCSTLRLLPEKDSDLRQASYTNRCTSRMIKSMSTTTTNR